MKNSESPLVPTKNWKTQYYPYLGCFCAGACGAFAIFMIAILVGYNLIDVSFISNAQCGNRDTFSYCFFDSEWNSTTYLSLVTGFYSTIITVLVAFLAVIAGFAFLVIRSSAHRQAHESMQQEVSTFLQGDKTRQLIRDDISQIYSTDFSKMFSMEIFEMQLQIERITQVLDDNGFEMPGKIES